MCPHRVLCGQVDTSGRVSCLAGRTVNQSPGCICMSTAAEFWPWRHSLGRVLDLQVHWVLQKQGAMASVEPQELSAGPHLVSTLPYSHVGGYAIWENGGAAKPLCRTWLWGLLCSCCCLGPKGAATQSYPCGVSSRAFKTAMTRPRWAPESFSRPMTITSPPRLSNQNPEGEAFLSVAMLSGE